MEERVEELERRVHYLEEQLEESYERHRFNRRMNSLIPSDVSVEIHDNRMTTGYHAEFHDLTADELNSAIENIEFRDVDYEWSMTETGEGIGLEVWTSEY